MSDETVETHEVTIGYDILTAEEAGIEVTDEMRARAAEARDRAGESVDSHQLWRIASDAAVGIMIDGEDRIPLAGEHFVKRTTALGGFPIADVTAVPEATEETDDDSVEGDALPRS